MNFFKLLKQSISNRRIQFDIVSVFVSLIIVFSVITTFFSYHQSRRNILELSKEFMEEVSLGLIAKLNDIRNQSEFLAEATRGLITSEQSVSPQNSDLVAYLLNVLKYNHFAYSIQTETESGNLLSAINITRTPFSIPEPVPAGTKYAIRFIDRSGPIPTETWEYMNTELDSLEKKSVSPVIYDLRINSWFEKTLKWPRIYWTNIHDPNLGNLGFTVSAPAINADNKVFGAIAVNLSLELTSNYFSHQQIGQSGRIFILDKAGAVFIPNLTTSSKTALEIPYSLIADIYVYYQKTGKKYFVTNEENIDYLASVIDFPVSFENHWYVIITVPQRDFIGPLLLTQEFTLFLSLGMLILFSTIVYFSSKHISRPIAQLSQQVNRIQQFDFKNTPPLDSHIIEIITLDSSIAAMRAALRSFERYVPKEIVKTLLTQGKEISLGGEKKEITVMFSDITDFTSYSESLALDTLMPSLTKYFNRLSKIIIEAEGTIDKFMGDGIMSFWGAPQIVNDQAYKACMAALKSLKAFDEDLESEEMPKWHTRFGIHSGEVIVGNIGTEERMNYSIIGDVVNTASRLEGINKIYHTSIIISDTIKDKIWKRFVTRPLDYVAVKGKKNKLMIHELMGTAEMQTPFSATSAQIELSQGFIEAYATFHDGKLEAAKRQFLSIQQRFPDDVPTQIYLKRIDQEIHPIS